MAELAVGIDLGTSNSCVAIARNRRVDVLANAYGERTTASVVNIGANGSITVGNAAKANIIHDPTNTIYSAKRLIGRYFFSEEVKKAKAICSYKIVEGENHSVRIQVREEAFSLPEVGAMVLRELKSIAESRLGGPVMKAVVTVPAYFNDNQRQATRDAARIAGLEVLRILNEPTAAALAYGFGKDLHQRVAVYDLGGGTFDISVLEIGEDVFEVLSTSGDTFLGGDDFDDRLIDWLADDFTAREGINLRNDPFALEKLKVAAENAKKGLSVEDEVEIDIPDIITVPDGSSRSIRRKLTTEEFWRLTSDLVVRTFKVCDEALQEAGIIARDLDGVILVGGPTRLPGIRKAVTEYFQQEPRHDVDPDEVVAMGAAIHAASLVEQGSGDAYLLDVTPLSLQVGVAGGLSEPVITRNTPVPIEQTRTFTTARDNQESVVIRVYQGESREAKENELLGQFEFSNFQRGARGEVEIDVTFEINTDGIVNVTATDKRTGERASTRITLSSGLSEREIKSIIERGVASRVQTATAPVAPEPAPAPAPQRRAPAASVKPAPSVKPVASVKPAASAKPVAPVKPAASVEPAAPVAPARPAALPDPAMIEDEDELIPTDLDDLDVDLLDETADDLADQPLDVISEATTQPQIDTPPPDRERPAAPLRANEVELSEEDLAGLDTSDLDTLADDEKDSLFDTSGADLTSDDPETLGLIAAMKMAPGEIVALARIIEELDYYQLLDLRRDAGAGEVKRAYHSSSRNFHPDANRHLEGELRTASHAIAKRITEAYAVLRDPRRRQAYDHSLANGASTTRMQLADASAQADRRSSQERGGRTPQGRQFFKLAEADAAKGNWAGAARNLQTALTFEPDNALFKDRLAQAKKELR